MYYLYLNNIIKQFKLNIIKFNYMIPKKKGRRPKSYYENLKLLELSNNIIDISLNLSSKMNEDLSKNVVHKKRGRKPKGGKIIEEKKIVVELDQKPNIILHLNCKLSEIQVGELNYDPNIYNIKEFDNNTINYDFIEYDNKELINNKELLDNKELLNSKENLTETDVFLSSIEEKSLKKKSNNNDKLLHNKIISKKLEDLSSQLKSNNINKKGACFWCTYNFDNEPIMIPKYELKNVYYCYGNFCSPECACSFLMNENIDSSHKFERYYLLNNIYCKIYNYEKNIKFAPSPYYTLEKFYGNLNIQEYRKLLENERLLLVVDKPLSKLLPEIYDENEDYILNNKSINKNSYKINVK